jgi:hypothetical protein
MSCFVGRRVRTLPDGMAPRRPHLGVVRLCTVDAFFPQCFIAVNMGMHKRLSKKEANGKEPHTYCNY